MVVAPQHRHEGIGHAQVGVLADADDGEQLVVGPVHLTGAVDVEVVAVVEVAIRGPHVAHGLGDLMDRIVVKGGEHVVPRCGGVGTTGRTPGSRGWMGEGSVATIVTMGHCRRRRATILATHVSEGHGTTACPWAGMPEHGRRRSSPTREGP